MSQLSERTVNGANGSHEPDDEVFRRLVLEASLSDQVGENQVVRVLRDHLGIDPFEASQVAEKQEWRHMFVIIQAGIDAFLAQDGRSHELVGVACPTGDPTVILTLAKLFTSESLSWPGTTLGPATWERLPSGYEKSMRCLQQGLILTRDAEGPAAIWVTTYWPFPGHAVRRVTVAAPNPVRAKQIFDEIQRLGHKRSPYAGEMFKQAWGHPEFMPRPARMTADDIILPKGLLERIDQHAIGVTAVAKRLRGAGQHLKRGLLLYGPPGTGKTHTLRYLASRLPAETTILVARARLGYLRGLSMWLPLLGDSAMIILDDIDSIATDRSLPGLRTELFELLELLDGLQGHGDVLFVLTTNRLDALEPAVSARPGRIDEALEVPRPDAECRRRLFARYRQGMDLTISDGEIEEIIERTDGVTGSFTKELLRRATIVAVEAGSKPKTGKIVPVTGAHVFRALDEMLDPENPATRLLLGAEPEHAINRVAVVTEEAGK